MHLFMFCRGGMGFLQTNDNYQRNAYSTMPGLIHDTAISTNIKEGYILGNGKCTYWTISISKKSSSHLCYDLEREKKKLFLRLPCIECCNNNKPMIFVFKVICPEISTDLHLLNPKNHIFITVYLGITVTFSGLMITETTP